MLPRVDPARDPLIAAIALDFIPVSLVLPPPMKAYLVLEKQRALSLVPQQLRMPLLLPASRGPQNPPPGKGSPWLTWMSGVWAFSPLPTHGKVLVSGGPN